MGKLWDDESEEIILHTDDEGIIIFIRKVRKEWNCYIAIPKGHVLYGVPDIISPGGNDYNGFNGHLKESYWIVGNSYTVTKDKAHTKAWEIYKELLSMITDSSKFVVGESVMIPAEVKFVYKDEFGVVCYVVEPFNSSDYDSLLFIEGSRIKESS
jgi:hypothetical protein